MITLTSGSRFWNSSVNALETVSMAPTLGEKKNSHPRGDCFTQRLSGFNDKTDRIESDKGKKDLRKKFWANKVGSP